MSALFWKVGTEAETIHNPHFSKTRPDTAWYELVWRRRLHLVRNTLLSKISSRFWYRVPDTLLPVQRVFIEYGRGDDLARVELGMHRLTVPQVSDNPGSWTPHNVAVLGTRILEALRYIHSCGVIHMDVACENIGLRDGTAHSAVLFDFTSIERKGTPLEGTIPRLTYGSIDEHNPDPDSRWTGVLDFDKLVIVLVRLLEGPLPWEYDVEEDDHDIDARVLSAKINFDPAHRSGRGCGARCEAIEEKTPSTTLFVVLYDPTCDDT